MKVGCDRDSKKIAWQKTLNFKDFLLVTDWVLDKKRGMPCFAIFTRTETHLLATSQPKLVHDWSSQLAVFSSLVFRAKETLEPATGLHDKVLTITNSDGHAYFTFLKDNKILFMKQIDGHMSMVEKHVSGVTYGVGVNGKLWSLDTDHATEKDSFKGIAFAFCLKIKFFDSYIGFFFDG